MSPGLGRERFHRTPELDTFRERLDRIDQELLSVLAQRFSVTREVGRLKASASLAPLDARREEEVLDRLAQLGEERGLDAWLIRHVYRLIFDIVVAEHRAQRGEPGPPTF
jgi:chorismate mutase